MISDLPTAVRATTWSSTAGSTVGFSFPVRSALAGGSGRGAAALGDGATAGGGDFRGAAAGGGPAQEAAWSERRQTPAQRRLDD
jgi:hypothetical protein